MPRAEQRERGGPAVALQGRRRPALVHASPASPPRVTPYLTVKVAAVERRYLTLRRAFPEAGVLYAVKANPAPPIIAALAARGSGFDVASPAEIDLCLDAGAAPASLSYGNTAKKCADIRYAAQRGVRLFACDSVEELHKIAQSAPGSAIWIRLEADSAGARWPLSRKFGCDSGLAERIAVEAAALGIEPCGVCFHVGSQQTDPGAWAEPLARARTLAAALARRGIALRAVNLGGGLPSYAAAGAPPLADFARAIRGALSAGAPEPRLYWEPGRYLVADAGTLVSEVVLVSRRHGPEGVRWVYLDIGRFGGLAETEGEAIRYRLSTSRDGGPRGPVVLAGPTCDGADILYEHARYRLPLDLRPGDRVEFHGAGAYTASYASICFNGFAPPAVYCD